jgi:hypothetical protein
MTFQPRVVRLSFGGVSYPAIYLSLFAIPTLAVLRSSRRDSHG